MAEKRIKPFRFWCQHVLPLVYDDSLSYYELLCKVVKYINNLIEDVNNLSESFTELKNFVDSYFANLDVQTEINNKLDEMAQDGTLTAILSPWYSSLQNLINVKYPPSELTAVVEDEDSSEAFIAIVNYAMSNDISRIYIPKGNYVLKCQFDYSGLEIFGTKGTIINGYFECGSEAHIEDSTANGTTYDFSSNFSIHDLEFNGNDEVLNGLSIYGVNYSLENLVIHNYTNKGLRIGAPGGLSSATLGYTLQIRCKNICCYDCVENNVYINGQSDSYFEDIRAFDSVDRRGYTTVSMFIDTKTTGCRFYSVHVWGLRDYAMRNGGVYNEYHGCHLEGSVVKLDMTAACNFIGQLYDTGENSDAIGVLFSETIRNCYIKVTTRQLYQGINFNTHNGNLNHIELIMNSSVSGAMLFDSKPNRNNYFYGELMYWEDGESTYQSYIVNYTNDNSDTANSLHVATDYYIVGRNSNLGRFVNSDTANDYFAFVPGDGVVSLNANGSNSNIDLKLTPKGSGQLILGGVYTSDSSVEPTGYLTVQLSNGTEAKILMST